MPIRRLEQWTRTHRITPAVTVTAMTSPVNGQFVVRADGWQLPPHFPLVYSSLEAAQRAGDDIVTNHLHHDCRQADCTEWTPHDPRTFREMFTEPDTPTQ